MFFVKFVYLYLYFKKTEIHPPPKKKKNMVSEYVFIRNTCLKTIVLLGVSPDGGLGGGFRSYLILPLSVCLKKHSAKTVHFPFPSS